MAAISVETAKNIAVSERPAGLSLLRQEIGWEEFDETDNAARSILLDFHYDNLMYGVQKGFPWQHICTLVAMAAQVAEKSKGMHLPEGIKVYHKHCLSCNNKIPEQTLVQFTQYFFETFFHHYQLYQYVFNTEQDALIIKVTSEVETPIEPLPFTDGKQIKIWEYEQKMKEIEEEEEKKKTEHEEEKSKLKIEKEETLQKTIDDMQNAEHPVDKESLAAMINEIASLHITAAGHSIKSCIDHTMEDVEIMLKKTSLPRPQELGAPTRYKPKTPLSGGKRPKSKDKTASRGSAKARAK